MAVGNIPANTSLGAAAGVMTICARISPKVEELGQDYAEFGIEAFPEFMLVEED